MIRRLLLALPLLLAAACTPTPESTPDMGTAAPAPPPKPWAPVPFDEKTPVPNDVHAFFEGVTQALEKAQKAEFETTKDYEARLADIDRSIPPFSSKAIYAFVPEDTTLSYNADLQVYEPDYSLWCYRTYPIDAGISCQLGSRTTTTETFDGQNAFGARATVTRSEGNDYYLVFPPAEFRDKRFRDKRNDPVLNLRCPMPVEKAKTMQGKTVVAAVLVRLREPRVVEGRMRIRDATIDTPYSARFRTLGLPVHNEGHVCYVLQTGEVFHREPGARG